MPIAARSAPNNGRVKEAKVSSRTRDTDKAVNGKGKRGDKRNVDRRANGNKRRGIDKATIGEVKREIIKIKIRVEERINLRMLEGMVKEKRRMRGSTAHH